MKGFFFLLLPIMWATGSFAQSVDAGWLTLDEMLREDQPDLSTTGPALYENIPSYTAPQMAAFIEQALEKHDWLTAEAFARNLLSQQGREEKDMGFYGLALALAQQARYEEAITTLNQAMPTLQPAFQQAARTVLGTLYIQRAAVALAQGDEARAQQNLIAFAPYAEGHPQARQAQRLQQRLTAPVVEPGYLRVGVLLPLSGPHAAVGKNLLHAMQMAVFDSAETQVVLYPEDTGSSAEGAATAGQKLLDLGVDALIGPLLSPQVEALKPLMMRRSLPVISLSSDPHVAGPQVHIFGYRPDAQARLIARQAVGRGYTRLAALVPGTPYGYEVFDAFRDEVATLGGSLVTANFYNPQNADLSPALESLLQLDLARDNLRQEKDALEQEFQELGNAMEDERLHRLRTIASAKPEAVVDFDALFLPSTPDQLPLITAQLAVYDVDQQDITFLGTATWQAPALASGSEYVTHGLFPAPPLSNSFTKSFMSNYLKPPNPLSVLGYDAVRVLAQAATAPDVATGLLQTEGFAGQGGAVRFHAHGLVERAYTINKLSPRAVVHVEPAPVLLPPPLPNPINPLAARRMWRW
jgi:ABC-type branched-subunit amino acid transport system substrate-binding protein